jgi:NAD+ kinase
MSKPQGIVESDRRTGATPSRIGLVVHPSRPIDAPVGELRRWADRHNVDVVQVRASCQQQQVAPPGDAGECDLILSIGGDGTMLAAIRAGAVAGCPVLGIACGSLGVLTTAPAGRAVRAVERFSQGDWVPRSLPALDVAHEFGEQVFAFNDIAIVRASAGQLRLTAEVDGAVFARIAGDGCIVSTPIGSSAYVLAAGGPLVSPETDAFVLMPLPVQGGSCPPLVVSAATEVRLVVAQGHVGARLEVDGQVAGSQVGPLTVTLRAGVATVVTFADQEPFLARLRRLQIITDSPRVVAEEAAGGSDRHPSTRGPI